MARAKHHTKRLHFNRIAKRGAGAVRFEIRNIFGLELRIRERGANHGLLRFAIGRSESAAAPVLICRGAANECENVVALCNGIRETFEHDDRAAFGAHIAVGRGIKRFAAALGRKHARLRGGDNAFRRENHIHAAGERHFGFARAQTLTREMHRSE